MRVIGAAGKSGRHVWPLVNMGGGGGGQVMLVAGREKVPFHGMPDRINTCLASEIGSGSAETKKTARFWRGRETTRCISALQNPLSAWSFFL